MLAASTVTHSYALDDEECQGKLQFDNNNDALRGISSQTAQRSGSGAIL